MKTIKNIFLSGIALITASILPGCTADFEDINTDIGTIYEVEPERLLYNVIDYTRDHSWEWTYDYYQGHMYWMQYGIYREGNSETAMTYNNSNMFKQRYENSFLNTGSYMRHMEYLANQKEDSERYSNAVEAARVVLIYQSIYTTDAHGSLAYTEGWSLRSGGTNGTPKFDTQEELFTTWDQELKNAISKFKTNTNQISLEGYDMAYNGDISKWIKAANALRLRIALRLLNRNEEKAITIAKEVLADNNGIPSSNNDSFIFWMDGKKSEHGDIYAIDNLIRASNAFMGYLNKYEDPRKRIYFRINNLTPENLEDYNNENPQKQLADYGRWVGGTASFDKKGSDEEKPKLESSRMLDPTGRNINMQPINRPQTRLFSGLFDQGAGKTWYPNVTYADFCFMAAEFVFKYNVSSSKSAENWYTDGVRASLDQWNYLGDYCKIHDYEPMTESEIAAFMNQPDIKWNPAKGLEQIYVQSYVEHFKNSNETWAMWRRTGYPTVDSDILALEECHVNGDLQSIPRRSRFNSPVSGTPNYENEENRLKEMEKDPEFGARLNEFGRLWWDTEN